MSALLDQMLLDPRYGDQIAHVEQLPARPGRFATPSTPLPAELVDMLAQQGIEKLYEHQVAALEPARAGQEPPRV